MVSQEILTHEENNNKILGYEKSPVCCEGMNGERFVGFFMLFYCISKKRYSFFF